MTGLIQRYGFLSQVQLQTRVLSGILRIGRGIERHFSLLKNDLRQAVESVFPEDPRWLPAHMAKALEIGVSVFANMFHRIPQPYIDGKSPQARCQEFDSVRAAARKAALFKQALNNEPTDQYSRHFHRFFQFPWEEKKTVAEAGEEAEELKTGLSVGDILRTERTV